MVSRQGDQVSKRPRPRCAGTRAAGHCSPAGWRALDAQRRVCRHCPHEGSPQACPPHGAGTCPHSHACAHADVLPGHHKPGGRPFSSPALKPSRRRRSSLFPRTRGAPVLGAPLRWAGRASCLCPAGSGEQGALGRLCAGRAPRPAHQHVCAFCARSSRSQTRLLLGRQTEPGPALRSARPVRFIGRAQVTPLTRGGPEGGRGCGHTRRQAFWTRCRTPPVPVHPCPGPFLLAFPQRTQTATEWCATQPGPHAALPGAPGASAWPRFPDLHRRAAPAPWAQPALRPCRTGWGSDQHGVRGARRAGSGRACGGHGLAWAVQHWPCRACDGSGRAGTRLPATVRAAQSLGDSACGSLLRRRGCTVCSVKAKLAARLCGTARQAGAGAASLCVQGWADCPDLLRPIIKGQNRHGLCHASPAVSRVSQRGGRLTTARPVPART